MKKIQRLIWIFSCRKLPVKTRKPVRSRPSLVPSLSTIQDFSNVHSATVDSNDEFFKHYFSRLQKHQEPPNVWLEFLNSGGKRSSSHNDSSLSVPISATREQRHWFHSKRKNFNDLWVKLEPMEEPSKLSSRWGNSKLFHQNNMFIGFIFPATIVYKRGKDFKSSASKLNHDWSSLFLWFFIFIFLLIFFLFSLEFFHYFVLYYLRPLCLFSILQVINKWTELN